MLQIPLRCLQGHFSGRKGVAENKEETKLLHTFGDLPAGLGLRALIQAGTSVVENLGNQTHLLMRNR